MKRSTASLGIGAAMLVLVALAAAAQGPALLGVPGAGVPVPTAAATVVCPNCFIGGLCQPCEDGGARPCGTKVCCGVTTITACGTCTLHCVPPPS